MNAPSGESSNSLPRELGFPPTSVHFDFFSSVQNDASSLSWSHLVPRMQTRALLEMEDTKHSPVFLDAGSMLGSGLAGDRETVEETHFPPLRARRAC